MAVSSNTVGKQICEAIGLNPDGVEEVFIQLRANELARVTVRIALTIEQCEGIHGVLKQYRLVPDETANP